MFNAPSQKGIIIVCITMLALYNTLLLGDISLALSYSEKLLLLLDNKDVNETSGS